ncbi:MAG: hypothetical protein PQJ61_11745 [Spirochaetales bacterium]|uniref:Uncharacterized protein n=1 Tax=Candidatus Thalassospirochaeta sargassi TaxID=3119039 RepID=A0AAJ1IHZ7_9SPIO|nr:hypothetical protein [Spirochaetales bacterium]
MSLKKMRLLLIITALVLILVGCEAINSTFDELFLSTTEVEAGGLDNYDTGGNAADSDADVDQGMELAFDVIGESLEMRSILGEDTDAVIEVLRIAAPDVASIVSPEEPVSRAAAVSASASVTDEQISDGDVTIDIVEASVSASMEVDDLDEPTKADAEFEAKLEIGITGMAGEYWDASLGDFGEYVAYTVEDFQLNVNGNGNGTMTFGELGYEDPEQIDYYTGLAVSLGFSISAPDCSGKYIATFKYVNNAVITVPDDPDAEMPDFTGGQTLEITVYVYDNSGARIYERAYTESELFSNEPS